MHVADLPESKPCLGTSWQSQRALMCTIWGPVTSYSSLVIHISAKLLSDDMIDPPIHTEYFLSGGAVMVTVIAFGTKARSSLSIRSAIPGYMVVPPESTIFSYKSFLTSTSVFMIELKVVKWTPGRVFPNGCGSNNASGHRKRSLPKVITLPSGSS